jgi:O-antigen ligase
MPVARRLTSPGPASRPAARRLSLPRLASKPVARRLTFVALALVPAGLTIFLAFNAGGYFAGSPALSAVIVAAVLVLWLVIARDPLARLSGRLAIAAGAFGLFTVWTLVSSAWSHAPGRAVIEFDRALLYLLTLVLFGLVGGTVSVQRWLVRGMAAAATFVCGAGLTTRLLPHVWPTHPAFEPSRLGFPITYWNGLGMLAAIGIILCAYLACADREPWPARILGAAALPVVATTLLFTFSRGAIAAAAIGVVAFLILARTRGTIAGVMAAAPTTAVAVNSAYGANLLARPDRTSAAAIAQGHHVAAVVGGCVLVAAVLRAVLLRLDKPFGDRRLGVRERRLVAGSVAAAGLVAIVVAFTAGGVGGRIHTQYERFVHDSAISATQDPRARLSDPGNNGRLTVWRVAVHAFDQKPLDGTGAGTFRLAWNVHRPNANVVDTAHSLYLGTMAELGIVGLVLVAVTLAAILFGLGARIRAPERAVYAASFAAALVWVLHTGLDWDWQLPVVTLWLFALGGAALSAARPTVRVTRRSPILCVALAIGVAVLAITPALAGLSQRHLNDSIAEFKRDDCRAAIHDALAASSELGARPEPWEIIGYCDSRLGAGELAVAALHNATVRDPNDWEFRYGLSLVQARAGIDPRPAAAQALALNPREVLARRAVAAFAHGSKVQLARRASSMPLDIP